jgi:hypothetical protein
MRLVRVSDGTEGHPLYTAEIFPAATAQYYIVTRPPSSEHGHVVHLQHGGVLHEVVVPAGVAPGGTFLAAVHAGPAEQSSWLVTKRYSEWAALDAALRRHPSLARALPPSLPRSEKGLQRRAACLSGWCNTLGTDIWDSTAAQQLAAADRSERGTAVALRAALITAVAAMRTQWHREQAFGAAGLRTWAELAAAPTLCADGTLQLQPGMTSVPVGMPDWMCSPGLWRRMRLEADGAAPLRLLIETYTPSNSVTKADTEPPVTEIGWKLAHALTFEEGNWWVRERSVGQSLTLCSSPSSSATPTQVGATEKEVYWELELHPHPQGWHECCRWGRAGEEGSAIVSWRRQDASTDSAQASTLGDAAAQLLASGWLTRLQVPRQFERGDDLPEVMCRQGGAAKT